MASRTQGRHAWSLGLTRSLSGFRRPLTRLLALPVAVLFASGVVAIAPAAHVAAQSCANPIVCENELPGTPQDQLGRGLQRHEYPGLPDPFSVNVGGSINFKIKRHRQLHSRHLPDGLLRR